MAAHRVNRRPTASPPPPPRDDYDPSRSWGDWVQFHRRPWFPTLQDWVLKPFVTGLFFGVAQHSAKYIVDAFFKPKREPVLIAVAAPRPPAAHEAVLAPPSAEPVAVAAPAPAPAEPAPAPAEPAPAEPAPEPAPQTPAPAPAPAAAPAQTQ